MEEQIEKCPVTELPIERIDARSYRIVLKDDTLTINFGVSFEYFSKKEIYIKNRHLIAGAILTKQLSQTQDYYSFSITEDDLIKNIPKIIYPKTPKDKLDNLFKSLFELQRFDGEIINIFDIVSNPGFYYKHFFKSEQECYFYLESLTYLGLINSSLRESTGMPINFSVTIKGLNYYLELTQTGNLSNKCFIAMSFDPAMKDTREAIKTAVVKNDFEPLIIDEQLIDSAQTINDAIISAIKSSKFCICDFTQQKDGVYFESGFAAGLGKSVIYSCHSDWFKKSPFDTNHFPHIIYDSNSDLVDKLDKKIKAWIK